MSTQVTPISAAADMELPLQSDSRPGAPKTTTAPSAGEAADFRLIIEKAPDSDTYVYKTVDRKTGEVVQQFPLEQILRLRQEADYHAGTVIAAKA